MAMIDVEYFFHGPLSLSLKNLFKILVVHYGMTSKRSAQSINQDPISNPKKAGKVVPGQPKYVTAGDATLLELGEALHGTSSRQ